jgi:hypothetical protein
MKKIFFSFLFLLTLVSVFCQKVKITEMPTAPGNGSGAYVPIVQDGVNQKILTDSLIRDLIAGKLLYIDTINNKQRLNVDSLTLVNLFGGSGGGGGTTLDSTLTSTAGQTTFPFPSVPTSSNDFIIHLDGLYCDKIYYTISGNDIIFNSGLALGTRVNFHRKK